MGDVLTQKVITARSLYDALSTPRKLKATSRRNNAGQPCTFPRGTGILASSWYNHEELAIAFVGIKQIRASAAAWWNHGTPCSWLRGITTRKPYKPSCHHALYCYSQLENYILLVVLLRKASTSIRMILARGSHMDGLGSFLLVPRGGAFYRPELTPAKG